MKVTVYFINPDHIYRYENVKQYFNHDDFIRITNENKSLSIIENVEIDKSTIKKIEIEMEIK